MVSSVFSLFVRYRPGHSQFYVPVLHLIITPRLFFSFFVIIKTARKLYLYLRRGTDPFKSKFNITGKYKSKFEKAQKYPV